MAINVTEGPDFPNAAAGTPFTLDPGVNTFSGTVNTVAGDAQDRFDVTVPPGMRITAVTKNVVAAGGLVFSGGVIFNGEGLAGTGSANFLGIPNPFPLPPGTYSTLVNANVSSGNSWTVTFTVIIEPDYTVTTTGGVMTLTDASGNGEVLSILQPSAGAIRFSAAGRYFRVNGGTVTTGASDSLALAGITSIVINAAGGDDTIRVGAFSGAFPGLTVNGGTGDDTVRFEGDISFSTDWHLDVDLQNDAAPPGVDSVVLKAGANLVASGNGMIAVKCSRNVSLEAGASLETVSGALTVEANQQPTPTSGNFVGVSLDGTGALIRKNSLFGSITVAGTGGDDASGGQHGIRVANGAKISSQSFLTSGNMEVSGRGGSSLGGANHGVHVSGAGSIITASSGLRVSGTGGSLGSSSSVGVSVRAGGKIETTGFGNLTVTGTGAGDAGSGSNHGVEVDGVGSRLSGGSVHIIATAGSGAPSVAGGSWGLSLTASAEIFAHIIGGVGITADSASLDPTVTISSESPVQFTATAAMDLGGADTPGVLGLTDAELDRVFSPRLYLKSPPGQFITITAPITRQSSTEVQFYDGVVRAVAAGADFDTAGGTLSLDVDAALGVPIVGATAGTGYPQFTIAGRIAINRIDLSGTTLPGSVGNSFVIVENDGGDAIGSAGFGPPEGVTIAWPGNPTLRARVSYVGGDGNDFTITLIGGIEVTNLNNSGPGSLRAALATAAGNPGGDIISFHPGLIFRVESVATLSNSELSVRYSRPVGSGAMARENYAINGVPWTVFTPGLATNQRVVTLPLTAPLSPGATYTLAIANVSAADASLLTPNPTHVVFSGTVGTIQATAVPAIRIPLSGEIAIDDGSGPVTIDASGIPGGVTLDTASSGRHLRIASGTTLHLHNLTLTGGVGSGTTVAGLGGAILNEGGAVTLTDCTLSNNSATAWNTTFKGDGGAIYNSGGTVSLTRSTLFSNHAYGGGGALAGNGGAIYNNSGTVTLDHCTLSGNTASGDGGAILNAAVGGVLALTHCTVSTNSANSGGGVHSALSPCTLRNSIVAGNTALTSSNEVHVSATTLVLEGANIVSQNSLPTVGPSPIIAAPRLAPLADFGGPTLTHALMPDSPALDAAIGSVAASDQRGLPIVGTADIGSYEAGSVANYASWAWETLPAGTSATDRGPSADIDGDARSNAMEFATLTDGDWPSSTVLLSAVLNPARTHSSLTIPYRAGVAGLRYIIDRSTSLLAWTPIVSVDSGTNRFSILVPGVSFTSSDIGNLTFIDATVATQPRVFHRLRIELDP